MLDLDAVPYTPAKHRRPRTEPVVAVCIHTAESSESTKTAEVLAAYFASVPRVAGIHYNVDCDSITCSTKPEIETTPHCYKPSGWSVGIEHAGRAGQGTAGWADDYSQDMLRLSAKLTAALCARFAIPVVKLTPEQVRAKLPGIFGHVDATKAFSVAGGHTDPGPDFPWDFYLGLVRAELDPPKTPEVKPMFDPALVLEPIVAECPCPAGGAWLLAASGAVYAFGGAPYLGAPNLHPYWGERVAARIDPHQSGYVITATSGETYHYGPAA